MSDSHERICALYDAANRGDVEAFVEGLREDVEWRTPSRSIRGRNAVAGWIAGWRAGYAPTHDVEELRDVGDQVLALVHVRYAGKPDSFPAHVWTLDGGKVSRVQVFPVRELGLRSLDLKA